MEPFVCRLAGFFYDQRQLFFGLFEIELDLFQFQLGNFDGQSGTVAFGIGDALGIFAD